MPAKNEIVFDENGNEVEAVHTTIFPEEKTLKTEPILMNFNVTSVYARTTFVGFHRWVEAPEEVKYLRDYHRHVFHVRLGVAVPVGGMNRGVEFIQLKQKLDAYLREAYEGQQFEKSCEMIGEDVCHHIVTKGYCPTFIDVSEDGENGSSSVVRYFSGEDGREFDPHSAPMTIQTAVEVEDASEESGR